MNIQKALIIRRLSVPSSMEYAEYCANSCTENGIEYEYIDGIENLPRDEAYAAVGVSADESLRNSPGHDCCTASHIKAWRRVLELNTACLILEHDAVMKGSVAGIDVSDASIVILGHRIIHDSLYTPPRAFEELIEVDKAIGTHAYALTPNTASSLISDFEENKVRHNLDHYLMFFKHSGIPLFVAEPPQAVCWPRMASRESTTEREYEFVGTTWTVTSSLKRGWYEGMGLDKGIEDVLSE